MSKDKIIIEIYEKPNVYFDNLKMIYAKVNKPYKKRYYSVWLANIYTSFELKHNELIGKHPKEAKAYLQQLMDNYAQLKRLIQ